MAPLSLAELKPFPEISKEAIPEAIRLTLQILFKSFDQDIWLVGGTALSGFYAKHRRSDDIDLFAVTQEAYAIARRAVQTFSRKAQFSNERTTPNFYHADVAFHGHKFTLDLVLDKFLSKIGKALQTKDGICVADCETLFKMKAACLISRVSEKDLFDLHWVFQKTGAMDVARLIQVGSEVDGGFTAETLLMSLQGAILRKEACAFLLEDSKMNVEQTYRAIEALRQSLIQATLDYQKTLSLSEDVKALKESLKDFS